MNSLYLQVNFVDTTILLSPVVQYRFWEDHETGNIIPCSFVWSRQVTKKVKIENEGLETMSCTQKCHEDCDPLHGKG